MGLMMRSLILLVVLLATTAYFSIVYVRLSDTLKQERASAEIVKRHYEQQQEVMDYYAEQVERLEFENRQLEVMYEQEQSELINNLSNDACSNAIVSPDVIERLRYKASGVY